MECPLRSWSGHIARHVTMIEAGRHISERPMKRVGDHLVDETPPGAHFLNPGCHQSKAAKINELHVVQREMDRNQQVGHATSAKCSKA